METNTLHLNNKSRGILRRNYNIRSISPIINVEYTTPSREVVPLGEMTGRTFWRDLDEN